MKQRDKEKKKLFGLVSKSEKSNVANTILEERPNHISHLRCTNNIFFDYISSTALGYFTFQIIVQNIKIPLKILNKKNVANYQNAHNLKFF